MPFSWADINLVLLFYSIMMKDAATMSSAKMYLSLAGFKFFQISFAAREIPASNRMKRKIS